MADMYGVVDKLDEWKDQMVEGTKEAVKGMVEGVDLLLMESFMAKSLGLKTDDFLKAMGQVTANNQALSETTKMWTQMMKQSKKDKAAAAQVALGKPPACLMSVAGSWSALLEDRWLVSDIDAMAINFYPMAKHTLDMLYAGVNDAAKVAKGMQYHLF